VYYRREPVHDAEAAGNAARLSRKKLGTNRAQLKLTQHVELRTSTSFNASISFNVQRTFDISDRLHVQQAFFLDLQALRLEEVKVRSLFHAEYNPLTTCGSISPRMCAVPLATSFATLLWPLPASRSASPCRRHRMYRITAHPATARTTTPCLRHRTRHVAVHPTVARATSPSPSHYSRRPPRRNDDHDHGNNTPTTRLPPPPPP
jgi:hypothetical protein